MGWWFGGAMVVVAMVFWGLSELVSDPYCTEGPCASDAVAFVGVVLVILIGCGWCIAALMVRR
jgi:hypothetical protein